MEKVLFKEEQRFNPWWIWLILISTTLISIVPIMIGIYNPVSEYGGWGIKGSSMKKAYNVSGNIGWDLYLKNGRKVLFGTQKSQAIKYAMEKMMNSERLNKDD